MPRKGSGSGLYSGGLTWSIVLRCDDHTGIFTCDGCARDPYFQWRSEGNWRPGAKLNFAPPLKKILKNDIEMSIIFN